MSKLLQSQLLRVAVVGVGHLGKWHADKYADSAACELVAVVDTSIDNARVVANQHGADAYSDYRDVISQVDAISLVVPTSLHYKIAREFLEAGIHCLVENCLIEKLITEIEAEVTELSEIAAAQGLVLQVRHIDIIPDLIDRPVKQISARGISILSGNVDNAALNLELLDFIDTIHQQGRPLLNTVGGRRPLATAIAITQLPQQKIFADKVFADTRQPVLQVIEPTARRSPSLPVFPEMTGQQVTRVGAVVRDSV